MGNLVWAVAALAVVAFVAPVELLPKRSAPTASVGTSNHTSGDGELGAPDSTDSDRGGRTGKGGTLNCTASSADAGVSTLGLIGLVAFVGLRRRRTQRN